MSGLKPSPDFGFNPGDWVNVTGGLWSGHVGFIQRITYNTDTHPFVRVQVLVGDCHLADIPSEFLEKTQRPSPLEKPKMNMGPKTVAQDIKPLPKPEEGQVWLHKKAGFAMTVLHVDVDHYGILRDRMPEGSCFIYRDDSTGKLGVRSTHNWEREMCMFQLIPEDVLFRIEFQALPTCCGCMKPMFWSEEGREWGCGTCPSVRLDKHSARAYQKTKTPVHKRQEYKGLEL